MGDDESFQFSISSTDPSPEFDLIFNPLATPMRESLATFDFSGSSSENQHIAVETPPAYQMQRYQQSGEPFGLRIDEPEMISSASLALTPPSNSSGDWRTSIELLIFGDTIDNPSNWDVNLDGNSTRESLAQAGTITEILPGGTSIFQDVGRGGAQNRYGPPEESPRRRCSFLTELILTVLKEKESGSSERKQYNGSKGPVAVYRMSEGASQGGVLI
jgi:hypothetical protein